MTLPGLTGLSPLVPVVSAMAILLTVSGCGLPSDGFDAVAQDLGLERSTVPGTTFTHAVFAKPGLGQSRGGQVLHVYLEGDGSPMLGDFPSLDPTPRRPLALRLMALDPHPAVYLGRPCYHGQMASPGCVAVLWTTGRYGEPVVASLAAAARRLVDSLGFHELSFFGHSGGGTLAGRMDGIRSVVTIAAVLDTEAWARERHIPLGDSLNPATAPGLAANIGQRHYAGGADVVVPVALSVQAAQRLGVPLTVIDRYGHICCWEAAWPEILRQDGHSSSERIADPNRRRHAVEEGMPDQRLDERVGRHAAR
jgi:pimeloyl-ACP methyl ester carboxylesterase